MAFGITVLPKEMRQSVDAVAEVVQLAEELGFNEAWIPDSQGIWKDVYVTTTVCAMKTSRILIGPGVTNPVTRHPVVTARAMATLDEISAGRAFLGIGAGDTAFEHLKIKLPSVRTCQEAIEGIRDLIEGKSVIFNGQQIDHLSNWSPRSIPIYVAAFGPKMLQMSGRLSDGINTSVGVAQELIKYVVENVKKGAQAAGRDPESIRIALQMGCSISADSRKAKEQAKTYVSRRMKYPLPLDLIGITKAEIEEVNQAYEYVEHFSVGAKHASHVPDSWVDKLALAGTAEECVEKLKVCAEMGIRQVLLMPITEDTKGLLRTVAERIMPHFL